MRVGITMESVQQRLVKTGGGWLSMCDTTGYFLAEGHLNRRRFGAMLGSIAMLPGRCPQDSRSGSSRQIGPKEVNEGAMSEKSLPAKAIPGLRLRVRGSPALRRPLGTAGVGNRARLTRNEATGCTMPTAWELKMEIPINNVGASDLRFGSTMLPFSKSKRK